MRTLELSPTIAGVLRHRRPPGQLRRSAASRSARSRSSTSAPRSIRWRRCWCRTTARSFPTSTASPRRSPGRPLKPGVTVLADETGRALGQVHPRRAGAGHLDLLRRPRPRGPAAPDRRRAHRPLAAPAFAGLPADPQQRALPGGEEEGTEDLTSSTRTHRARRSATYLAERDRGRATGAKSRSSPSWIATGVIVGGARRGARHGGRGAGAARHRAAAARCCCTTTRAAPARALGRRPHGRGAAARRRRRLRHRQQRRHASSTSWSRCRGAGRRRGSIRFDVVDDAGRARAGRGARWASTRTGRASGTWPPTSPTRTTTAACRCSRPAPASASRFAYLVPALAWARANGERTVVSTNTINLQEQLVGKDLPLLRDALRDRRPTTPTLRAAQGMAELSLPRPAAPGGRRASARCSSRTSSTSSTAIADWAGRTADGTLSDLPVDAQRRKCGTR